MAVIVDGCQVADVSVVSDTPVRVIAWVLREEGESGQIEGCEKEGCFQKGILIHLQGVPR